MHTRSLLLTGATMGPPGGLPRLNLFNYVLDTWVWLGGAAPLPHTRQQAVARPPGIFGVAGQFGL